MNSGLEHRRQHSETADNAAGGTGETGVWRAREYTERERRETVAETSRKGRRPWRWNETKTLGCTLLLGK